MVKKLNVRVSVWMGVRSYDVKRSTE